MKKRKIGDWTVGAIGLGVMPMALTRLPDVDRSVETIRTALDAGVLLIDTADIYAPNAAAHGYGEWLVAEAMRRLGGTPDGVLIGTKGGHYMTTEGKALVDCRPERLRARCEASLKILGVSTIELYQLHRPDPAVPYAESVGALLALQQEGKIRMIGISNADVDQIRTAIDVLGEGNLTSVQNQLAPNFRTSEGELELCTRLGVAFLAWGPLGGMRTAADLRDRFPATAAMADAHRLSVYQVTLAWLLAKSPFLIPLVGASRPASIEDSALACDLKLSDQEIAALDAQEPLAATARIA